MMARTAQVGRPALSTRRCMPGSESVRFKSMHSVTYEELGCVALFSEREQSSGSGVDAGHSDGKDRDSNTARQNCQTRPG